MKRSNKAAALLSNPTNICPDCGGTGLKRSQWHIVRDAASNGRPYCSVMVTPGTRKILVSLPLVNEKGYYYAPQWKRQVWVANLEAALVELGKRPAGETCGSCAANVRSAVKALQVIIDRLKAGGRVDGRRETYEQDQPANPLAAIGAMTPAHPDPRQVAADARSAAEDEASLVGSNPVASARKRRTPQATAPRGAVAKRSGKRRPAAGSKRRR